jgi:hypothetical protein
MRIKSNISHLVVIGFIILIMSMTATVKVRAGGPQTIQCKNLKATYARIGDLLSMNRELGRNRNITFHTINIAKESNNMKKTLDYVERDTCGKKKPPRKCKRVEAHGSTLTCREWE